MMILIQMLLTLHLQPADAYQMRVIQVPLYSRPWVVLAADGVEMAQLQKARVHFHGWTQDPKTGSPYNPRFDFEWKDSTQNPSEINLRKMVDAFEMNLEVELHPDHLMIIPVSRGHCDQYQELKAAGVFEGAIQQLLAILGVDPLGFRLVRMSAHSGGGDLLSRLILTENKPFSPTAVTVFDGIYSSESAKRFSEWIIRTQSDEPRALTLITLPNQRPSVYSSQMFQSIPGTAALESRVRNNLSFEVRTRTPDEKTTLKWIQEKAAQLQLNHWTLVPFFWME